MQQWVWQGSAALCTAYLAGSTLTVCSACRLLASRGYKGSCRVCHRCVRCVKHCPGCMHSRACDLVARTAQVHLLAVNLVVNTIGVGWTPPCCRSNSACYCICSLDNSDLHSRCLLLAYCGIWSCSSSLFQNDPLVTN